MKIDDKEINFDSKDMTDEMKKEFKKTGKIHIEKTGDDGEDVKIAKFYKELGEYYGLTMEVDFLVAN